MAITQMTETIVIRASPEVVWKALTDLEGRVRWNDRLREMSIVGGSELAVGSQIRIRVDRRRFKATVTELDPPSRMAMGSKSRIMGFSHTYHIRETAEEHTELSLTGVLGGPFGLLILLIKESMRRDLRDELAPVKAAAEASVA